MAYRTDRMGSSQIVGPRPGRMRDRRSRGQRGPLALPGPLTAGRVPQPPGRNQRFDRIVESVVSALEPHLQSRRPAIDVVIDHVPILPDTWDDDVPLCTVVDSSPRRQLVVFRRPHLDRAADHAQLTEMVWHSILECLAATWRVSPDDVFPGDTSAR